VLDVILNAIEEAMDTMDTKISWQDIADAAGITKSALSHFKKGTELKFPTLLKIAKFVFKKNYFSTFRSWCLDVEQPKNVRYAMEYLAVNKLVDELEQLINKTTTSSPNCELLDWVNVYKIQLKYLKNESPSSILNEIRLCTPKSVETKTFLVILQASCKNRLREYNMMAALSQGLDKTIDTIKDDFIKTSYQHRLKEILSYVSLYAHNDPVLARKYASEIISSEFCATLTAHSYYIVGMSYLLDNYDECLGNILNYRDALIQLGRERDARLAEQSDIPFINNVWKKYSDRPVTSDISEIAHYEAVSGDKDLAVKLLDEIMERDGVNGFRLYYKAIATGDESLFMQSIVFFVHKSGAKHFATLPYRYIKDNPALAPVAELLLN
jgi:transcriptional regulator with XRE-family HTH domain